MQLRSVRNKRFLSKDTIVRADDKNGHDDHDVSFAAPSKNGTNPLLPSVKDKDDSLSPLAKHVTAVGQGSNTTRTDVIVVGQASNTTSTDVIVVEGTEVARNRKNDSGLLGETIINDPAEVLLNRTIHYVTTTLPPEANKKIIPILPLTEAEKKKREREARRKKRIRKWEGFDEDYIDSDKLALAWGVERKYFLREEEMKWYSIRKRCIVFFDKLDFAVAWIRPTQHGIFVKPAERFTNSIILGIPTIAEEVLTFFRTC